MKNFTFFLFVLTLLISCNESTTTNNEENIIENEIVDTPIVESNTKEEAIISVVDTAKQEKFYFEDYLQYDSREKLAEIFGTESLVEDTTWYAEGTEMYLRTTLHDPYTGYVIEYIWTQEDITQLEIIEAHHLRWDAETEIVSNQTIHSTSGVYLGMPILELRDWNEADFDFLGFGWDFSGGIMADDNSKITQNPLRIRLDVDYENYNSDFMGDGTFNTRDVSLNDGIFVGVFILYAKN